MKNKQTKEKIQQTAERALAAFKALEEALSVGDNYKIGARMAELRWELKEIQNLVSEL
jgi:hypothetical protein